MITLASGKYTSNCETCDVVFVKSFHNWINGLKHHIFCHEIDH